MALKNKSENKNRGFRRVARLKAESLRINPVSLPASGNCGEPKQDRRRRLEMYGFLSDRPTRQCMEYMNVVLLSNFVPLEARYDIGEVKKMIDVDEDRSGWILRQFLWRSTPECGNVVWTYLRKFRSPLKSSKSRRCGSQQTDSARRDTADKYVCIYCAARQLQPEGRVEGWMSFWKRQALRRLAGCREGADGEKR
jgi:hypothetical protein